MNWINSVIGILVLAVLVAVGYKVGQIAIELNSPATTNVSTTKFTLPTEQPSAISMRWNHFPLTVYIDADSVKQKSEYIADFKQAMRLWQSSTNNLVSFSFTTSQNADVTVEWAPNLKEKATDTLGNTDIKFINVTGRGLIQNAVIQLLTKSDSRQLSELDMTNLALHEIGHSLGLSHSSDENDIMYPILIIPSKEIKKISAGEIKKMQDAYKLPPKPDLRIIEANVNKSTITRFGRSIHLLNVSLLIENSGILDVGSFVIQIRTENEIFKNETAEHLSIGDKLNIFYGNLLVEHDFKTVQIILDPANSIDEMNEENNFAQLNIT